MNIPSDYQAFFDRSVYFEPRPSGYLRLGGPDRVDFLHRQSTNDIHLLSGEHAVLTALTTAAARLLDVFYLIQDGEAIGAISLTGNGAGMYRYLKNHIFFTDKVTLEDASQEVVQLVLAGPLAGELLQKLGAADLPAVDGVCRLRIGGKPAYFLGQDRQAGLAYRLLAPAEASAEVQARLAEAGGVPLSAESYELIRVENGLPGPERELTGDYTPFEVNLKGAVSGAKGCYTGQEVLARQVTYDKVVRGLAGLHLESEAPPGTRVQAGDKPAGAITSSILSPRFGPIALAMLRRPYGEPGTALAALLGEKTIPAQVVSLPFPA